MAVKPRDIITDVEMKLGQNNALCDYPGKMITAGTMAIALYWLSMAGLVVYSINYHSNNNGTQRLVEFSQLYERESFR